MKGITMKNEKIGTIGEAFIQRQLESGIVFDAAWDNWQEIQNKLMFIVVHCPEVQWYDDRRICDREERQRIRQLAKSELGKDIRSSGVSMLGHVATWLQVEVPVQQCRGALPLLHALHNHRIVPHKPGVIETVLNGLIRRPVDPGN